MEHEIRAPRRLIGLVLATSALAVAACGGAGPSGAAPSPAASAAPSAAPSPAATSAPTPVAAISIDKLPEATFIPAKVAVACDPATLGTGATMSCNDIGVVAARVAPLMSTNPIQQLAVKQSATPGALDVTFWVLPEEGSGVLAFTFTIDPVNKTFTLPLQDTEAVFPTAT